MISEQLDELVGSGSTINSKSEAAAIYDKFSTIIYLVGLFLAALTGAISIIMLLNNSSLMLNERRSELGILLAMGMPRRGIRRILYGQIYLCLLPGVAASALIYGLLYWGFTHLIGSWLEPLIPWLCMGIAAAMLVVVQAIYLNKRADRFASSSIAQLIETIE